MAVQITNQQLQIKCRFNLLHILECRIHSKYGEHTKAEIKATVKSEEAKAAINNVAEKKIEILGKDIDSSIEQVLFVGSIQCITIKEEGQYTTICLNAVSNTWKMDIKRRSRSFQNPELTYKKVAEAVAQEYEAAVIWNIPDKKLEQPLIQYKETDYQFLKRVVSHVQNDILTGDYSDKISIYAGLQNGTKRKTVDLGRNKYSIIPFYTQKAGRKQQNRVIGYRLEHMDYVRAGDLLQIEGSPFYVMEAKTVYIQGALECTCSVFPKKCFQVEKIPAQTLSGAVLNGRILKTRQETVKMHLDIDMEQPVSEAHEFPWEPITGNMLYCMPEIGTKAALYFDAPEESTGRVIYSIRENSDTCDGVSDHSNKYFTTDNRKRMYLKPYEMGLINLKGSNADISIKDGLCLNVSTVNKLSVQADGKVELKGKNVKITTPIEATLVRKDVLSPTVINLCNAFDAIGQTGNFASNKEPEEKNKKRREETIRSQERYSLEGALGTILSNI
ncbi:MAG: phage late control D family protein, partial [Lachnospiraceae bacterium]|nr:phage late control D family protein [Lachnospiraceae bacterium]